MCLLQCPLWTEIPKFGVQNIASEALDFCNWTLLTRVPYSTNESEWARVMHLLEAIIIGHFWWNSCWAIAQKVLWAYSRGRYKEGAHQLGTQTSYSVSAMWGYNHGKFHVVLWSLCIWYRPLSIGKKKTDTHYITALCSSIMIWMWFFQRHIECIPFLFADNAIPIKSWFSDPSDTALLNLLPMLDALR